MKKIRLWLSTLLVRAGLRVHPAEHLSIVVKVEDRALTDEDLAARGWTRA